MARKNALDYTAEDTEYQDEVSSDVKTAVYPGAAQGDGSTNAEFKDKLIEHLDGRAASVLKYEHNLADYDTDDRKSVVDAYVNGFNDIQFNDHKERHEAAQDLTHTIFNPLYKEIDLRELREFTNVDPRTVDALESEGIKQVRYVPTDNTTAPDGSVNYENIKEFYLKVDDLDTAHRIVDKTEGTAAIVSRDRLQDYEDHFAAALYNSGSPAGHPDSGNMNDILNEAIAYSRGELPNDDALYQWMDQHQEQPAAFPRETPGEPAADYTTGPSPGQPEEFAEGRPNPLAFLDSLKERYSSSTGEPSAGFTDPDNAAGQAIVIGIPATDFQNSHTAALEFLTKDHAADFDAHGLVNQFNDQEFQTPEDRQRAARDAAQAAFQDINRHAEFLNTLDDQAPSDHPNTPKALDFRPSAERLERYQGQFSDAMDHSSQDPRYAASILAEIHREAADYVQGTVTDYGADATFEEAKEVSDNGASHHTMAYLMQAKVLNHWHSTLKAIEAVQEADPYAVASSTFAHQAVVETYAADLTDAVKNGDQERYDATSLQLSTHSHDLAFAIRESNGFMAAQDYQPPVLQQDFATAEQANIYVLDTRNALKANPETLYHPTAERLADSIDRYTGLYEQGKGDVFLQEAHNQALTLNYFMQPRNPADEDSPSQEA